MSGTPNLIVTLAQTNPPAGNVGAGSTVHYTMTIAPSGSTATAAQVMSQVSLHGLTLVSGSIHVTDLNPGASDTLTNILNDGFDLTIGEQLPTDAQPITVTFDATVDAAKTGTPITAGATLTYKDANAPVTGETVYGTQRFAGTPQFYSLDVTSGTLTSVYNPTSDQDSLTFDNAGGAGGIIFSGSGSTGTSSGPCAYIERYDIATNTTTKIFGSSSDEIYDVVKSPDGKYVYFGDLEQTSSSSFGSVKTGQLYRIDISSSDPANWTTTNLTTAANGTLAQFQGSSTYLTVSSTAKANGTLSMAFGGNSGSLNGTVTVNVTYNESTANIATALVAAINGTFPGAAAIDPSSTSKIIVTWPDNGTDGTPHTITPTSFAATDAASATTGVGTLLTVGRTATSNGQMTFTLSGGLSGNVQVTVNTNDSTTTVATAIAAALNSQFGTGTAASNGAKVIVASPSATPVTIAFTASLGTNPTSSALASLIKIVTPTSISGNAGTLTINTSTKSVATGISQNQSASTIANSTASALNNSTSGFGSNTATAASVSGATYAFVGITNATATPTSLGVATTSTLTTTLNSITPGITGVAFDGVGQLFGNLGTINGYNGGNVVVQLDPQTGKILRYSAPILRNPADPTSNATLDGICYDSYTKHLFVGSFTSASAGYNLFQIDPSTLTLVSSYTIPTTNSDYGTGSGSPDGFTSDGLGSIFIADYHFGILKFDVTTGVSTFVASTPLIDDVVPIVGVGAIGTYSDFQGVNDIVVNCFMPGTLIATPGGGQAVETLGIGDAVLTAEGVAAPVLWIGRHTVSTRFADPLRALPIRVRQGALGDGLPVRDLLLSPRHALLVDGVLVEAGALVNGTSIVRAHDVPEVFTYYHVELADHALILAEGTPAETFVDNASREAFDNWEEHEALFPEGHPVMEMAYPRAQSARQVPASMRRRLAAVAEGLGFKVAVAA